MLLDPVEFDGPDLTQVEQRTSALPAHRDQPDEIRDWLRVQQARGRCVDRVARVAHVGGDPVQVDHRVQAPTVIDV
jgi:hypothetical protein